MESERDMLETPDRDEIAAALREDERAAAAPWIDYPPTPAWYPVAGGLWFGAWAWIITADQWWSTLLLIPMVLLLGVYVGWYRRRRGTTPRWTGAPREINRALWVFAGIAAALVVGGLLLDLLVGRWPMIAWVAVGVAAGLALYERRYAVAARQARARLA
ncbi:hypothetical protein GCM10023340_02360 [Nocardioides marinquilinus]|uniref:DUF2530 domain-containing protein n=1 Tax=Nocardioides marinquilinus TaxID=1210400 RepID=A0ABP9P8T9_9ACTN